MTRLRHSIRVKKETSDGHTVMPLRKRYSKQMLFVILFLLIYVFISVFLKRQISLKEVSTTEKPIAIIYPPIQKNDIIDKCNDNINIYLQLVLSDPVKKKLINDFYNLILSILSKTRCTIQLFIAADSLGKFYASSILDNFSIHYSWMVKPKTTFYNIHDIARRLVNITKPMKELFSTATSGYYSHVLFFTIPGLHRVLSEEISRIIILDVDMIFENDIKLLWKFFDRFKDNEIMALAYEQQPVYYHLTTKFRERNPSTVIGKPLPNGNPGLNGGVKLFDLRKMRDNTLYNSFLDNPFKLRTLADKYYFRGHLGDQDFYTLLSFDQLKLISVLPCNWNRQLCEWWKKYGYRDIFDFYSNCSTPHNVLHGNCNTKIPSKHFILCFAK